MTRLMKYLRWWQLDILISLALAVVCTGWFALNHAWGAWGDDAPGYIYTASQILHHQSLVSQDALVQQALSWFDQERWARFVAPAHHEIISPSGWIASRYPIGLGLLMALVAGLAQWNLAIYLVVPLSAVVVVVATYWCALVWLPLSSSAKRLAGLMAASSVALCSIFANYAVAEPMREIPSMAFFLLGFLLLTSALFYKHSTWLKVVLLVAAGLCYGYSINIRETSAILFPSVLWLFFCKFSERTRAQLRRWFLLFCAGLVLAGLVSIWTTVTITQHKEKFRSRDITNIAITSNFDHIQSLSFKNLYNNEGKFRPGVGGVKQYWEVLQTFNIWPPFLLMALGGIILLYRKDRHLAIFFLSWFGAIFLLFAMWINPYPRYILPLLPVVALLSAYGTIRGLQILAQLFRTTPTTTAILNLFVIGSFFASQQPAVMARHNQLVNPLPVYKAISYQDTVTLQRVADQVEQYARTTQKPPLLFMLGTFKGGLAETIMSQTALRVIRFPGKPNEQPPLDQLTGFVNELNKTFAVVVWYDTTTSSTEQQWLNTFSTQQLATYNFSFQDDIILYAITKHN